MCYAGLERAVEIARVSKHMEDVPEWRRAMHEIRREILSKGWSGRRKAFRMHYGTDALDSASLLMPLIGFTRPRDRRIVSTVDAVMKELARNSLLYRYKPNGGAKTREGAILVCIVRVDACVGSSGRDSVTLNIFM